MVPLLYCLPNILPKKLNLTHPNEGLEGYTTVRSFWTVKYFFCFLLVDWYFRGKDNKGTTTDAVTFGRCTRTALRVRHKISRILSPSRNWNANSMIKY